MSKKKKKKKRKKRRGDLDHVESVFKAIKNFGEFNSLLTKCRVSRSRKWSSRDLLLWLPSERDGGGGGRGREGENRQNACFGAQRLIGEVCERAAPESSPAVWFVSRFASSFWRFIATCAAIFPPLGISVPKISKIRKISRKYPLVYLNNEP